MSTFIGKYEAKADLKGRVFVPAAYRKLLQTVEKDHVVMRKDTENDCLIIYPEQVWDAMMVQLKAGLDEWNPDDQMLLMQFVSDAEWIDIDAQGRILLSKRHMQMLGVENSEVLFVGMNDRFAVWGRSRYEQSMKPKEDFARLLKEKMMNKG